jgi:peptidoglycan/LPS O-acetylase OafA/YrhL
MELCGMSGGKDLDHRLPALDGVRAIAILLVLAGHFIGIPGMAVAGVSLFFVLSGFLITRLLAAETEQTGRVRMGRFYWRRACRIIPAYLVWVGVTWIILGDLTVPEDRSAIAGLLTYTYNYSTPASFGFNSIIHPAWSLAVEEQFYLLWPLMFSLMSARAARRALLVCFAAVAAWRVVATVVVHLPQTYLDWAFEANAGTLALGCWLALYTKETDKLWWLRLARPRWLTIWLGVFICSICLGLQEFGGAVVWAVPLAAIVMFFLISAALEQGSHRLLSHPLLRWIAAISYPLYLWHLWGLAIGEGLALPHALQLVAALIASLGLASASYYLLERPILRWRDRRRAAPSLSAATP